MNIYQRDLVSKAAVKVRYLPNSIQKKSQQTASEKPKADRFLQRLFTDLIAC